MNPLVAVVLIVLGVATTAVSSTCGPHANCQHMITRSYSRSNSTVDLWVTHGDTIFNRDKLQVHLVHTNYTLGTKNHEKK